DEALAEGLRWKGRGPLLSSDESTELFEPAVEGVQRTHNFGEYLLQSALWGTVARRCAWRRGRFWLLPIAARDAFVQFGPVHAPMPWHGFSPSFSKRARKASTSMRGGPNTVVWGRRSFSQSWRIG